MRRPELGEVVRMHDRVRETTHLCTVVVLLDTQFRATYEQARHGGGWMEHSMFDFYKNHGDSWETYVPKEL